MLPNYSHILVATDLTPNAVEAFKHAVMMARRNNARLHLLYVVPDVDASVRTYISTIMGQGSLDKFEKRHEEEAREEIRTRLEAFARAELADHPEDLQRLESIRIVHGHPAVQILAVADDVDADVVVMGSHGKGALEHTFLGSVAEKVLRKCRRPVFIIPLAD
jgi:nucleotide-binding universal stress UspA family protein